MGREGRYSIKELERLFRRMVGRFVLRHLNNKELYFLSSE
jgi:hypothetical protein